MIKRAKAPVRIDFGGGTTDVFPFTHKFGGVVLNAAINKYISGELKSSRDGITLQYHCDVPTASGLGTSGAMNLVWLTLISDIRDKVKLANNVFAIEQAINIIGGRQDQYTAALGGINFLVFKKDKTYIKEINLDKKTIRELEKNLLLCYTGRPRKVSASDMNKKMINNLKRGDKQTIQALKNIKEITIEMKNALIKKSLVKFAELFNKEWENRKKLHPAVTNKKLDHVIKVGLENGALGAKVCGAAGGGCILFYCVNKKNVKNKLKNFKLIDFKFDFKGLQIKKI